mgnify:CR=1 FL=1
MSFFGGGRKKRQRQAEAERDRAKRQAAQDQARLAQQQKEELNRKQALSTGLLFGDSEGKLL